MTENLQSQVAQALDDLKGRDIKTLDVRHLTCITDYMIICTGTSSRHVQSLADNVLQYAKQHDIPTLGYEGEGAAEWVLVDLGDVIVHIMQESAREFYNLEKLWDVPEDIALASSS